MLVQNMGFPNSQCNVLDARGPPVGVYKKCGNAELASAVARVYSCTAHAAEATTKVLHHLSYHMPPRRCVVVARVAAWLEEHAFWVGELYSSWRLPDHLTVGGICGASSNDFESLGVLLDQCQEASCVCQHTWQRNVCV